MASRVLLVRHGQTAWSVSGQHTGRTDVPLLEEGRAAAKLLGERLHRPPFDGLPGAEVRTSPLARARETCALAGFGARATDWDALLEWDYGAHEGLTPSAIQQRSPGWQLWRDGAPGGESVRDVTARADTVVARARAAERDTVLFAHGHILRAVVARWLGLDLTFGARVRLAPASLSVLGVVQGDPVIDSWNDTGHLR